MLSKLIKSNSFVILLFFFLYFSLIFGFYINENLELRQEILKLETLISELRDRILNPDPPDTSHSFSAEGIEIMKLDLDRAEKDLEELKARYLEKNYDLPNE